MSQDINHAGRAHALLSASGADRWMHCTPSARIVEGYPTKEGRNIFAEEGTLAHEYSEYILRYSQGIITKEEHDAGVQDVKLHELYSPEMDGYVDDYVTVVLEQLSALKNGKLLIEEKVDFSQYVPDGFGTGDALLLSDTILQITDLKYGKGVQVFAQDNSQLRLYALGALTKYHKAYPKLKIVRMTIVQPRLNHTDTWEISIKDLLKWAKETVVPLAKKAYAGEGDKQAGKWCRWCAHAPRCEALRDLSVEEAKSDFAIDVEDATTAGLTDAEMVQIYHAIPTIQIWINAVQEYMHLEALKGKKWKGLKLVEGRSQRVWSDQDAVLAKLEDELCAPEDILNIKVKGITAIEALLGKKQFKTLLGDLVIRPKGSASLVPASDKRPEMGLQSAKNDFADPID